MRELALFAGAGGGLLGSHLLRWRPVVAVESDPRCRAILFARQRDGALPRFPIWDDVRTFNGAPWRGAVDIVTGGFPCQAHSTASRGRKVAEDLWPDMLRVVREVEPRAVLAENVQRAPVLGAARDLAGLGYACIVFEASAAAVGAAHERPRWWVAADADRQVQHVFAQHGKMASLRAGAIPFLRDRAALDSAGAHGLARRLDVYPRAVGNGQVPHVVQAIGRVMGWSNA